MKRIAIGAAFVAVVLSCAGGGTMQSHRDDFRGYTIEESRGNTLAGGGLGVARVQLDPQVMHFDVGATGYRLLARFNDDDWLFIRSGESLGLNIDGSFETIEGAGSLQNRDVLSGGRVAEAAIYLVAPALICRLAAADSVAVRLYGQNGYVDRSFSTANTEAYRTFVAAHLAGDACSDDRKLNVDQLVDSIAGRSQQ